MQQRRVVLCGYYGFGNGGDEALLATLLQMLPDTVTPVVLSGNPEATTQLHGVEACDRNHFPTLFKTLATADAFIWGGGSLIQDATSALSPLYYSVLMAFAQRRGLKTIAWAQGIGPLQRGTTRWLAKQMFRGCQRVSVRDRAAATLAQDWDLEATLAPDPVWALASQSTDIFKDLPSPRIAVSLREHPQLTAERLQRLGEALAQLQSQTQASVVLVPFQPERDGAIATTLQSHLTGASQIVVETDPRQLKGLFQQVDLAICMRLHALIMAAAEGCRCFAISYDPKVQRVMEDIDCRGWDVAQLPTDVNQISEAWRGALGVGQGLTQADIDQRVEQARQHQAILQQVLS